MILEKIRQLYPHLTKSQRKLADFIATNYQEAAFMTASKLARRLNINEATVIRFAQRLDYRGYPELAASIQEVVRKELAATAESWATEGAEDLLSQILNSESESLKRATNYLPQELASDILAALQDARHIYLIGQGLAAHLAGVFSYGLRVQGYPAQLVSGDALELAVTLGNIGSDDVIVGFCVEGESNEVASALKYAKQAGSRSIAFTGSSTSPVAQVADIAVICPANGLFDFPTVTVMAAFIDALLQLLALEDPRSQERRRRARLAYKAIEESQINWIQNA